MNVVGDRVLTQSHPFGHGEDVADAQLVPVSPAPDFGSGSDLYGDADAEMVAAVCTAFCVLDYPELKQKIIQKVRELMQARTPFEMIEMRIKDMVKEQEPELLAARAVREERIRDCEEVIPQTPLEEDMFAAYTVARREKALADAAEARATAARAQLAPAEVRMADERQARIRHAEESGVAVASESTDGKKKSPPGNGHLAESSKTCLVH
ncbi:MAG: hypothetical protein LBI34_00585 [Puniceicoccales bacterium]|jgi:hypothetical protein|nr:hypothetical protein [Puniceicoccales bacterium]